MSPVNYTFGPPGLNNLACQWFSNLHCKSGVLPVISERMTFLHCVSSDVPSNYLLGRKYSRIGCIFSTFLHCVSSDVSSNYLLERMYSRIGCIFSTCLHCAFSDDPRDPLKKRQNYKRTNIKKNKKGKKNKKDKKIHAF